MIIQLNKVKELKARKEQGQRLIEEIEAFEAVKGVQDRTKRAKQGLIDNLNQIERQLNNLNK